MHFIIKSFETLLSIFLYSLYSTHSEAVSPPYEFSRMSSTSPPLPHCQLKLHPSLRSLRPLSFPIDALLLLFLSISVKTFLPVHHLLFSWPIINLFPHPEKE